MVFVFYPVMDDGLGWAGYTDFFIFMIVVFRVIEHSDTRLCLVPLFSSYFIVFTQILARDRKSVV